MSLIQKVLGCDFELSNTWIRPNGSAARPVEAAHRLLEHLPGYPRHGYATGTPIEWGRRFLRNGGSAYCDMGHLEMVLPCHARSTDHALYVHAALRTARKAQVEARETLPKDSQLLLVANNCDGVVSYGNHLRTSLSRRAFQELHSTKPQLMGFWATHLVTSVIYAGQGMVGAANGKEACDYQLAQRPDFFSRLLGIETTERRPIINTRDESHSENVAAAHTIYYDRVLSPGACRLQAVTTQLVLAMIEANFIDVNLQLDDPVAAASVVSRDLELNTALPIVGRGRPRTALEIQQELCALAGQFIASGECGDAVPDAAAGVAYWQETLERLAKRDIEALAGRCDNWLKYLLISRQLARRGLSWNSPAAKVLDILFGSLDPNDSLFFQSAAAGQVEDMPSEEQIEQASVTPPRETRAFMRAYVLQNFGEYVSSMDWSYIQFRIPNGDSWCTTARMELPDPRAFGHRHSFRILHEATSLIDLVERVNKDAEEVVRTGGPLVDEFTEPAEARPMHVHFR